MGESKAKNLICRVQGDLVDTYNVKRVSVWNKQIENAERGTKEWSIGKR